MSTTPSAVASVIDFFMNICRPKSAPQSLTVAILGDLGTGKKTLATTLNGHLHVRAQDSKCFVFHARVGTAPNPTSNPTSIALVTVDSSVPRIGSLKPTLDIAREAAPYVCVVFTKSDLIPRDYSMTHLNFLEKVPNVSYVHDIDCISVSTTSREGLDDLFACIVNNVDLPMAAPKNSLIKRLGTALLDWIASWFALPAPKTMPDVSADLATIRTYEDVANLINGEIDAPWGESLKDRFRIPQSEHLHIHRITPSLAAKVASQTESDTMEYVRRNTSIPIPRIHRADLYCLIMDFIDGETLYECWDKLSWIMQFRIACTLRLYVKQLRSLKRMEIGSVDNKIVDGIFFDGNQYTPFDSVRQFRRFCEFVAFDGWRRYVIFAQSRSETPPPLPQPNIDWTPVFTHGDLNGSNVLLDRQGSLWLIDWGVSGFYPACIESLAMRHVEHVVHPCDVSPSWPHYRNFIAGTTTKDEEGFLVQFLFGNLHLPMLHDT
ncbi:hypothetical protein C8Q74DRAFT_1360217 [Fomes fomentarius]|nr:hypothetical protein C8Q74DRAFT_1360217 [Fomes fomentarius]